MFPIYAAYKLYCYFVSTNSFIKRDAETFKGDLVITTLIFEDHITVTAPNGSVVELEYDKIKKISATKNYILIITKARLIYILKKDGFTKGNFEEFTAFIKNKGINIKK
ncbi:MAG: YcxB family protein [Clostridia bacterium]|nr:YcxB family protein [Clostridia bacterium]